MFKKFRFCCTAQNWCSFDALLQLKNEIPAYIYPSNKQTSSEQ
jgi:hypothetical protein